MGPASALICGDLVAVYGSGPSTAEQTVHSPVLLGDVLFRGFVLRFPAESFSDGGHDHLRVGDRIRAWCRSTRTGVTRRAW